MIDTLPSIPERRLALRLTSDALRQVRGGHPWVYADSITSVSDPAARPGTLAVIFDQKRRFVAIGLWDPNSVIRVRVLHTGAPAQIDARYWDGVVASALVIRAGLIASGTTGYRLLNGENDGTGGLVADVYDRAVVVKVYSEAWFAHLAPLVSALLNLLDIERVVLRLGRSVAALDDSRRFELVDGTMLAGDRPYGPVSFRENGLEFEADVLQGPKTGHFLDQRENRARIGEVSSGARVLDLFSCTGGFSVNAAAGGAQEVHSVDIAEISIAAAQRNVERNSDRFPNARHTATVGDAFEVMADLASAGKAYDIVIVDPPSFASKASERDRAIRAYRKLTELALPLVRAGGRLFQASCSSRVSADDLVASIDAALVGQERFARERQLFGHALDHPVTFPQGGYLKAFTAIVD